MYRKKTSIPVQFGSAGMNAFAHRSHYTCFFRLRQDKAEKHISQKPPVGGHGLLVFLH